MVPEQSSNPFSVTIGWFFHATATLQPKLNLNPAKRKRDEKERGKAVRVGSHLAPISR